VSFQMYVRVPSGLIVEGRRRLVRVAHRDVGGERRRDVRIDAAQAIEHDGQPDRHPRCGREVRAQDAVSR